MAGLPVVTVANGGLAVTPVASGGLPVTEAANGMGLAVTVVSGGAAGMGVTYEILVPTITLSGTSFMYENTAIGTTIGTLSVLFPNGTYTFSKTSDPDSAFTLTGTTLKNSFLWDYETKTSHPVTIQATNGVDAPISRTFTVLVGDIDEVAPVILTSATQTIAENIAFSITLTADKSVTWSKTGGADSGAFTLAGAALSLPAQDFEDPLHAPAYVVQVTAASTAFPAAVTNKTITVNVTNVADTLPGPPAGTLTWVSGPSVNPPVFSVVLVSDPDLIVGDVAHFQRSTAADFSTSVVNYTNTVDSTEDAANALTFSGGGTWPGGVPLYVRERTERPGHDASAWTNIVSQTLASAVFDPNTLFASGEHGGWWDPSDHATTFQDTAGTTPANTAGQPVARINDKSGNGNHLLQSTSGARPILRNSGTLWWLEFDGVDDYLSATFSMSEPYTRLGAVQNFYPKNAYARIWSAPSGSKAMLIHSGTNEGISLYDSADGISAPTPQTVFNQSIYIREVRNSPSTSIFFNNYPAHMPAGVANTAASGFLVPEPTTSNHMYFYGGLNINRLLTTTEADNCRTFFGNKGNVLYPPLTAMWGQWAANHTYAESAGAPSTPVLVDGDPAVTLADMPDLTSSTRVIRVSTSNIPVLKSSILNGYPVVRFTGSAGASMSAASGPTGNGFSVYAVAKQTSNTKPYDGLVRDTGAALPRWAVISNGAGNLCVVNGSVGASATFSAGAAHLVAAVVDNTGSFPTKIQIDNNTLVAANAAGGVSTTAIIQVATNLDGFWNGDIAEILIYEAVHDPGSGDGLKVRQYLNTKYNLGLGI